MSLKDKIKKFNDAKQKSFEVISSKKKEQDDLIKQNNEHALEISNVNMRLKNALILNFINFSPINA